MFLPPEQRRSGPPHGKPRPPRREPTKREEAVLIWLVGVVAVLLVLAPIGGGTLLEAVWYFVRR